MPFVPRQDMDQMSIAEMASMLASQVRHTIQLVPVEESQVIDAS